MVENFGSYLKHERELRGVPLEEISEATKIHIRYLKALEENSFDQLPGEVFIKGYIRSYAKIIGSDVEEMLNIYKESVELKKQKNTPRESYPSKNQPKAVGEYVWLTLITLSLLIGLGFLIKNRIGSSGKLESLPSVKNPQGITPEPSTTTSHSRFRKPRGEGNKEVGDSALPELSSKVNLSNPAIGKKAGDDIKLSTLKEPVERTTKSPVVSQQDLVVNDPIGAEKPLKLTIQANENSWFNMTIDDFREEDFILSQGSAKTFQANDTFRLTVGNKTGVELLLNGRTLTMPEGNGKVVKDFIINSKLVN